MKILQIGTGDFFSTYGGGQVYVKNLVDELIEEWENVSIISFKQDIIDCRKKDYKGRLLVELPASVNEDILLKIIREINPDIIHVHSNKHLICRIGSKHGIPVVVTAHHGGFICPAGSRLNHNDEICEGEIDYKSCVPCVLRNVRTGLKLWYPIVRHLPQKTYDRIGKTLRKLPFIPFLTPVGISSQIINGKKENWIEISEKSSLVIAPSERIARILKNNGLDSSKIKVLAHGIPLPQQRPSFPDLKDGKIKFFYVGRIGYIKGLHVLLKAFSEIKKPDIELHIIGGEVTKAEKKYGSELRKKYRKDRRIIWHGKIDPDKIYETIKEFHISVLPTICLEIFGLNIAESLAMGKPVIASKCGGGEMQIKHGINGWLVWPNDVKELKNCIEEIIDNSEELVKISDNCSTISMKEHCEDLKKFYKNVIDNYNRYQSN